MSVKQSIKTWVTAAQLVGEWRASEIALLPFIRNRRCFVDIGANRGIYSQVAASIYADVIAFEPIAQLAEAMRETFPSNCRVECCALAQSSGMARFRIPHFNGERQTELASLRDMSSQGTYEEIEVKLRTLDEFDLGDISVMKIDVEGAEYDVLRGALATIRRTMPVMIIEIEDRHTNGDTRRIFDLLFEIGYAVFVLKTADTLQRDGTRWRGLWGALRLLGWPLPELVPVDRIIAEIHDQGAELNHAILANQYINNFIFVPRSAATALDHVVYERRESEVPTLAPEWIIRQIKSHGLMDEGWYLDANPDVAAGGMDPVEHYEFHGRHEGRNPRPDFDTDGYLKQNPELVKSGLNPLWFWFRHEGRHMARQGGFQREAP